MKNLSLGTRVALVLALAINLLILIAIVGYVTSDNEHASYTQVAQVNLPIVTALEEIKFAGSRLISSANELVLDRLLQEQTGGEGAGGTEGVDIATSLADYQSAFDTYHALINQYSLAEDSNLLAALDTAGQNVKAAVTGISSMSDEGLPLTDLLAARSNLEDLEREFISTADAAVAEESSQLAQGQIAVDSAVRTGGTLLVGLSLLAIFLTVVAGRILHMSVVNPVVALRNAVADFQSGDMTVRARVDSTDELGEFARTFNGMAERIQGLVGELQQQVEEARAARSAAERANQVKSAFLASMSHELRTPLNAVINFTRFVVDGDTGPINEQQSDLLTQVVTSARHLLDLINDVLDMSKIEAGSLNLFVEDDVDLAAIIDSVTTMGRGLLDSRPVQIKSDLEGTLPLMRGDRQRIFQVLLNVMSNACKFTEQGEITLATRLSDGEVTISIADTGPGIAPEDTPLVFEPFKQTHSGLRQGQGTGLGMPIARSLVEAHGGRMWLESVLGKGTTFFIVLPVHAEVQMPVLA